MNIISEYPRRTPYWRIRQYQKYFDKWQKSYFGYHFLQDVVYVGKRTKEIALDEALEKIEKGLENYAKHFPLPHQAIMYDLRYIENEEVYFL